MDEHLKQADDCLGFAWGDLREALKASSSVESIILLDLIRQVAETRNKVKELINAREADK